MGWRAFIGEWPGSHRTFDDQCGLTWEQAREVLASFADETMRDNIPDEGCVDCYQAAMKAFNELGALPPDTEWKGDIDWNELRLFREDTT